MLRPIGGRCAAVKRERVFSASGHYTGSRDLWCCGRRVHFVGGGVLFVRGFCLQVHVVVAGLHTLERQSPLMLEWRVWWLPSFAVSSACWAHSRWRCPRPLQASFAQALIIKLVCAPLVLLPHVTQTEQKTLGAAVHAAQFHRRRPQTASHWRTPSRIGFSV